MNTDVRMVPQEKCTGCGACENGCPVNAVKLQEGKEGFLFPAISEQECIHCGKCISVCPVINNKKDNRIEPKCRAAYGADELRMQSSSGAIFSLLSAYVFQRGGAVYGVVLDQEFQAVHKRITSQAELPAMRRSKYVQSRVGLIYRQIKKYLEEGKWVLFSGTPCQNAGLKRFLGGEKEKLILVDLVCHGVPSQKSFDAYLEESYPTGEIKEFLFRIKDEGQNCMVSQVVLRDGRIIRNSIAEDSFEKGFHQSLFLRKSCGECEFAGTPRPGEFTIGDFWGLEKYNPDYTDGKGVSLVFLNNEKADRIWEEIKPKLQFDQPVPTKFALSHNRFRPKIKIHPNRERFFREWEKEPFSVAVEAAMEGCTAQEVKRRRKRSWYRQIMRRLKSVIKKCLRENLKIGK